VLLSLLVQSSALIGEGHVAVLVDLEPSLRACIGYGAVDVDFIADLRRRRDECRAAPCSCLTGDTDSERFA